jgi:hypothetical protein
MSETEAPATADTHDAPSEHARQSRGFWTSWYRRECSERSAVICYPVRKSLPEPSLSVRVVTPLLFAVLGYNVFQWFAYLSLAFY